MGSKWAGEAFIRVLRLEMQMQELRIDACMLNPGVVKPTALQAGGMALMDRYARVRPSFRPSVLVCVRAHLGRCMRTY